MVGGAFNFAADWLCVKNWNKLFAGVTAGNKNCKKWICHAALVKLLG